MTILLGLVIVAIIVGLIVYVKKYRSDVGIGEHDYRDDL